MTESLKNLPLEVQGVGSINRRGNIIDDGWYIHITFAESGHAHLLAIMILADIYYWYTPTVTPIEGSDGNKKNYSKKFASDKLQKSYKSLGAKFGVSKRMAQTACYRLKELQLITIEVRTVGDFPGLTFLEPISENIKKISCMCLEYQDTPITFKCDTPDEDTRITSKSDTIPQSKAIPPTLESDYTYTTTKPTLHRSEKEECVKEWITDEKPDDELGPDHQGEKDQGENEDIAVETRKPDIEKNMEPVLITSQFLKLMVREGATKEQLATALIKMDKEPDLKNPIAFLTVALRNEIINTQLACRPKTENLARPKTAKPAKTRKSNSSKYDNFYL